MNIFKVPTSKKIKAFILRKLTSKSKNKELTRIRKVLFFRYDRIGDMILTTPVFREFKKKYTNTELFVLASKYNQDIIKFNPYVDKIYTNHKNNFFNDLKTLLFLRKQKIDVIFEFDHSVIPHAIIRLKIINPKMIISVKKDGRYGLSGSDLRLYDCYSNIKSIDHARDRWLRTLTCLNIKSRNNKYDIYIDNDSETRAESFIKNISGSFFIGFNFEGAVKGKKVPFEDFSRLSRDIESFFPEAKIIVLTQPKLRDEILFKVNSSNLLNVVVPYPSLSILDVASLIKRFNIVISPDTSIVHIASTFNIPIISIHENNKESFNLFRPVSEISRTLFSTKKNSLKGYDYKVLREYTHEVINLVNNR